MEPQNTTPAAGAVSIDSVRQKRAAALLRERRLATRIYTVIVAVIIASVILYALQSPLPSALIRALVSALLAVPVLNWQPIAGWSPLLVFVCTVVVSVLLLVIYQPFVWYCYFVIPRRYDLLKDITALNWLRARGKVLLIRCLKMWSLVEVVTLLITVQPRAWWIWATLVQFLFSLLLARFGFQRLLPRLVKTTPLPEEVIKRFHALLDTLHIPACSLVQVKSGRARAFHTGWGKGHCIVLTDTLVQNFTFDEIEVILAHELAHLVRRDTWKQLIIRSLSFLGVFLLISLFLDSLTTLRGVFSHLSFDQSSLSLLLLSDLVFLLIWCLFFGCFLLIRRYYRHREYRADEFALQTTGKVLAFKSAMTKLATMNMRIGMPAGYARYASTHPTLQERLRHADEFTARQRR